MLFFAIIVVLLFADFCVFTFWDRYIVSFLGLLAIGVGAYFLLPTVAEWVNANGTDWRYLAKWAAIYLGAGAVVATIKWFFFNFRVRRKLKRARDDFKFRGEDPIQRRKEFIRHIDLGMIYKLSIRFDDEDYQSEDAFINKLTPQARKYVDRVTFWALQWPFVVVGLLLEDILFKIGVWLSDLYDAVFTRFARMLVANAVKDL